MFYLWRDGTMVCGCKQQGKRRGRELVEQVVVLDSGATAAGNPPGGCRCLLLLLQLSALDATYFLSPGDCGGLTRDDHYYRGS